jgi:hypothetical protein
MRASRGGRHDTLSLEAPPSVSRLWGIWRALLRRAVWVLPVSAVLLTPISLLADLDMIVGTG